MHRNLATFVEDTPEFSVRDGHIHVAMGALRIVMPVHVFMDGSLRGEAAIAQWHLDEMERRENNVIPLLRRA
jgi:hypothetical protein